MLHRLIAFSLAQRLMVLLAADTVRLRLDGLFNYSDRRLP